VAAGPSSARRSNVLNITFIAVLALGIFLRLPPELFREGGSLRSLGFLHPDPAFQQVGFDEGLYRSYVNNVIRGGLSSYPDIVDHYIELQRTLTGSILPPMRFFYIFAAYLWHQLFGTDALLSLHYVASLFGVVGFVLGVIFAWRLKGYPAAVAIAALLAFAPTQIHMSQHALVDGVFAFWAILNLWLLWENLRAPRDWRWLTPFIFSLAFMVMTKENAAFVYFALLTLLAVNRWLHFGEITRELLACMLIGPLIGVVVLVTLAGGVGTLVTTYQLSVGHNYQLPYAIKTGDGPWHRYIVDLLLVSPLVTLLALAAVFRLQRTQKVEQFVCLFIASSYLVMCNLKYGMNLRYANMWDMPLRVLAFAALASLTLNLRRYRTMVLAGAVVLVCAVELRQYLILFVQFPLYELVSEGLLRALKILK
jgi:4-amino-4-deoxy-L-arabinose transferase-like glycosyltransferase